MKNTIIRSAAILATSAFVLAGCGAVADDTEPVAAPVIEEEETVEAPDIEEAVEEEEPAEEEPAVEQGGPGVYQAELMGGGIATVAVPGKGPEDIEQLRKDAGVDPVGYLVIEVDKIGRAHV